MDWLGSTSYCIVDRRLSITTRVDACLQSCVYDAYGLDLVCRAWCKDCSKSDFAGLEDAD